MSAGIVGTHSGSGRDPRSGRQDGESLAMPRDVFFAHEISFVEMAANYDRAHLGGAWMSKVEEPSPFLRPDIMQHAIDEYHARAGIQWSFGGYLEDRTHLRRGGQFQGEILHAGLDMNLPVGTPVRCTKGGVVHLIGDDATSQGGWGPYVVIEVVEPKTQEKEHIMYAHLVGISAKIGERVEPNAIIGTVGTPPRNGGRWSHLHIQVIKGRYFEFSARQGLANLHGYFRTADKDFYATVFRDPSDLVWDPSADIASGK